ncbi:ATP-binding protein [Amycolatopsis sp. H6(2020)]|nr:ATP-binding protein [Amycolatopsis sp. H6(2020)]
MPTPTPTDDTLDSTADDADDLPGHPDDLRHRAIPATAQHLDRLRDDLTAWALRTGLAAEQVDALQLAAYEAMANVVVHAYRGTTGALGLHASCRGETVTVTVTDRGQWQPAPRPGPLHGRGLPLIHTFAGQAAIETTAASTTVTMTWVPVAGA